MRRGQFIKYVILFCSVLLSFSIGGPVITWVPPYAISESKQRLEQNFGEFGMKDGLTHLALQFWVPDGPVCRKITTYGNISDEDILWFRDWGRQHNIKVLLCIFNAENGWDWPAAINSFNNNQDAFVASSVAEMERLELDGIEIDLEGPSADNSQKDVFINYVRKTAEAVHPKGGHVTVATFAYIWNAPNSSWWADLMDHVDGITSMGYAETGANTTGWASYEGQVGMASDPNKLMVGMPGWESSWMGNSVLEQVTWVANNNQNGQGVGIGIWDAALTGGGGWHTSEVWELLAEIAAKDNVMPVVTQPSSRMSRTAGVLYDVMGRSSKIVNFNKFPFYIR